MATDDVNLSWNELPAEPFKVFAEEMRQGDVERRIQAMKKVVTVALTLGPEKTRSELLPMLKSLNEEEEEVLYQLADALGKFGQLVGGGDQAHLLLPLLERLASEEETIVREKAVESLVAVASSLSKKIVQDNVMALWRRLLQGDWFCERISAAGLIHVVYPQVDAQKQTEMREAIVKLSRDEAPMVRRGLVQKLPNIMQGR